MRAEQIRRRIPWWMAAARAAVGPLMVVGQAIGSSGGSLALAVLLALLSDIFDGVLARRWRCDTPAVRLFDTIADTVFYAGTGVALWWRHPTLVRSLAWPLAVVGGLELSRLLVELTKFGKPASYHSRLAKLWGLCLATAAVCGFLSSTHTMVRVSWLLALALGIACDVEGLAMSLVLPVWRKDIRNFRTAWRLRTEFLEPRGPNRPAMHARAAAPTGLSLSRTGARTAICAVALVLVTAPFGKAEQMRPATWVGGTAAGLSSGTTGQIGLTVPERLVFRPDSGPEVVIPYIDVQSFSYRCTARHHLGVLPAIAIGLIAARQHRHTLTLGYTDPVTGTKQVAIFELSRDGAQILLAVLRERTSVCAQHARQVCGGTVQ